MLHNFRSVSFYALLACCALVLPLRAGDDETKDLMTDDGRLDPAWFGAAAPDFHRCEGDRCKLDNKEVSYDYLWVKPGFSLKGHTLHLTEWAPAVFRGAAKRDDDEMKNGRQITTDAAKEFLKSLGKAWQGVATVSAGAGDLVLTGRVVDTLGPAGFGAFQFSSTTYDLKINDAASGELLLALHTRHGSGRKVVKDFFENSTEFLVHLKQAEKLYAMGETLAAADARHKKEAAAEEEEKNRKKKK